MHNQTKSVAKEKPMHCCEFCLSEYPVRPQVINPRACTNPECQLKRQRLNEREWRLRHPELRGTRYHSIRRQQRAQRILALAAILRRCLQVGVDLLGIQIGMDSFLEILQGFLIKTGVRRINKFWKFEEVNDLADLNGP